MKWLLITTAARTPSRLDSNPGDRFACMGVEKLVRHVDPHAEVDYLDKEDPLDYQRERPFDKTVMCGMPCVWSLPGNECADIFWWDSIIRGWPTARKKDFLIAGAGEVHVDGIHDVKKWTDAAHELIDRSFAFTARQPIMPHSGIIDTICPSAFCMLGKPSRKVHLVCNFMPTGGHFGYAAADADESVWPVVASVCREFGCVCVAHNKADEERAHDLGFKDVKLFHSDTAYIDFYANTRAYVGNRVHGAAVVAANGRPAFAITHDSRLNMVQRMGGVIRRPHKKIANDVALFLSHGLRAAPSRYAVGEEWNKMVSLFTKFARA